MFAKLLIYKRIHIAGLFWLPYGRGFESLRFRQRYPCKSLIYKGFFFGESYR